MPAIGRAFDYLVPDHLVPRVRVGTIVRVRLHGRPVRGWVVALDEQPETDRPLQEVARVTGWGPAPDVLDLARWAAWRWAGREVTLLRTASPLGAVRDLPRPGATRVAPALAGAGGLSPAGSAVAADAFARPIAVVRIPPADDLRPLLLEAARRPDPLVLAPTARLAADLGRHLASAGVAVARLPEEWARAAAGGCVAVGTRRAAWVPRPRLGAVLVVDEHDEAHQEERAPTWNGRDVAVERARRAGAPCVLASPCPSLQALAAAPLLVPARADERAGWPVVEVVDRRADPPGLGLYSERLVSVVREGGRVVCLLNRKGRARLLACASCGELARCEICQGAVEQEGAGLRCRRCGAERPGVCAECGAGRLKVLRAGVTKVRDDLERLAGRPVVEMSADRDPGPGVVGEALVVGTEAALHRLRRADVVAFLDLDQELMAPRYRAAEQAMALLARAARLVGGRDQGRLLLQTRMPGHETVDAAVHADPSRLALVESARRAALRLPPETALAAVSGPAAEPFVESLRGRPEVEVVGAAGGRWLVRAADHQRLCDALAVTPRPPGRLRVSVDPPDA